MARALQPVSIDGIEFDALINAEENFTSTVPEYTVESGYTVSDNIVINPETLNFTLVVSDMPVTWARRFGNSGNRVAMVTQRLKSLYFSKTLVTVTTSKMSYSSMAITKLGIPRSNSSLNAIEITIELKKVRITATQTTSIPDSYGKSGTSDASAGTANTTTESGDGSSASGSGTGGANEQKAGSILYELANSIGLMN